MRGWLNADFISELVSGVKTVEIVQGGLHIVQHPALLDQISNTVTGRTLGSDSFSGGGYSSKPAGRIDCLAFLERINKQSYSLAHDHGIRLLPIKARLGAIGGALGSEIKVHPWVRGWWATARILTQHDAPPFAPDVPCPVDECGKRGTIRIRLEDKLANCVECHTVWTEEAEEPWLTFGRLAEWIRWASERV